MLGDDDAADKCCSTNDEGACRVRFTVFVTVVVAVVNVVRVVRLIVVLLVEVEVVLVSK